MKKEFVDKERQLRWDVAGLEKEDQDMVQDIVESCSDAFRRHSNLSHLGRGIVAGLIKAIYIHEGGDITIKFNFTSPYKRIAKLVGNCREE